jgi:cytoskeletal protein RodZ
LHHQSIPVRWGAGDVSFALLDRIASLIMTQTIGQRLKAEREEQRLTLDKVFEATRIRVQYLQALEADDLSIMPSPVQARGYLRNYAKYLGFDVDRMLDELRTLSTQPPSEQVIGPADPVPPPPQQDAVESESLYASPDVLVEVDANPAPVEVSAVAMNDLTVPIKPKPARRKKADSSTAAVPAEPTTRRRGRKKATNESLPVVEALADAPPQADESVPPANSAPLPAGIEPTSASDEAHTGPALEEGMTSPQATEEPASPGDSLWQTWRNRLGSVLSARMKRRALVPAAPVPEDEPMPVPTEPVVASDLEDRLRTAEHSDDIFEEIGRELRTRRELLSLHFDEVERNTHVKAHYLDALERGALDELPSTVQTRGMLSNYATFLDLDVDALLLRFADALQARHRERNPQKPPRKPGQPIIANMPPVRSFIAGDMIFGVGMAILLVGFAIWGVSRVMTIQSQREVNPTAPSISDVLLASPDPSSFTATPTFLPVEAFPGEPTVTVEIPTQNVNAPVQLNLIAVERTYMRVTVDGEVAFDGRVVPGNAYPFEAESQVEVLVGSGAAIRTVYNGRDLGLMGTFGQVVNNIYSSTEIITPTAIASVTPTVTLTSTSTAVPTSTVRLTDTAVPSATTAP